MKHYFSVCVFLSICLCLTACRSKIIKEPCTNQEVSLFADAILDSLKHDPGASEKERQFAHAVCGLWRPRISLTKAEQDELFVIFERSRETKTVNFSSFFPFGPRKWITYLSPDYSIEINGDSHRYEFGVFHDGIHQHPAYPAVLSAEDFERVKRIIAEAIERVEIVDGRMAGISYATAVASPEKVAQGKMVTEFYGRNADSPGVYCFRVVEPGFETDFYFFLGCEGEFGFPIEAFTQFYLLCGGELFSIKTPEDVMKTRRPIRIRSAADVLAYARLFTNREWFYCFSDPVAIEVYPEKTTVKPDGCGFIITRTLLFGKDKTPEGYRLAEVEERISCEGAYKRKITAERGRSDGVEFGFSLMFE